MPTPSREYEEWLSGLTLKQISSLLRDLGCTEGFVKSLASNDNSKQQIYLASELVQVTRIPSGEPTASTVASRKPGAHGKVKYQSAVDFHWITPGGPKVAPRAKLIFYPQYPEVRFSGFLAGCEDPPSSLLNIDVRGAEQGRTLILAPNEQGQVFGIVLPPESAAARELWSQKLGEYGVMSVWNLSAARVATPPSIFEELCRISRLGYVDSIRLDGNGLVVPYSAQNGGGFTLEAHLGIRPNGRSEPDYQGWEVKQHGVTNLTRPGHGVITMFTPEPDGGTYQALGVETFLRRYGYIPIADQSRVNFSSIHRCSESWNEKTDLRIVVDGYEPGGAMTVGGRIILEDRSGEVAASWSFDKLLGHWVRKHANAVFVPSLSRVLGARQYQFGHSVIAGTGTTFVRFLDAVIDGTIYYDPGINMKRQPDGSWKPKKRNQFRTKLQEISVLYDTVSTIDSCHPGLPSASRDFDH